MKRIFSDFAYGPGPRDRCWWDECTADLAFPALDAPSTCDVAIVGAGFTGVSAAYHLARAGASVVVLDAERAGWGASGRNGGFCCLGGGMQSDAALDRRFGEPARRNWRETERAAVEHVAHLLDKMQIDADRHSNGETCLAHRPRDAAAFESAARGIEKNYGVTPDILGAHELAQAGMAGPFHGAITTPIGFGLNPRKYIDGLIAACRDLSVRFFDRTPVTDIDGGRVVTPKATLSADRVILATNGYSSEDVPDWMAGRYMPAQSTVIVTRPLSDTELRDQGWTTGQMAYDTRTLLHYFRLMPDGRFLFGMRGGLRSSQDAERRARRAVQADFRRLFPALANVEVTHAWSGMVCLSRDRVPFVGPVPGQPRLLAGFAYHGNGVAMGTHAGRTLADLALGRAPDHYPEIMKHPARRFPLGPARRLVMPPLYAVFRLGDLLP